MDNKKSKIILLALAVSIALGGCKAENSDEPDDRGEVIAPVPDRETPVEDPIIPEDEDPIIPEDEDPIIPEDEGPIIPEDDPTMPGEEEVVPPDTQAVLSWSAPLARENGVSLSMGELSHYLVYYGQDSDNLTHEFMVGDAAELADISVTVEDLAEGTWYFAVRTVDQDGLVSRFSEIVSKTIEAQ